MPSTTNHFSRKKRKIESAAQGSIMSDNSLQMLKAGVGPLLKANEMSSLSRTSKTMRQLFKKPLAEVAVKKLLQHVAYGEEKEADSLLEQNPHLLQHFLTDTDTVTDYAGHRIHGTAYQIALGAEDEDMLAMLQKHFSRLEKGCETMQAQQAAQFPAEEEKAWALRQSQDSEALRRVAQAIAAAPNAEVCAGAIQAFQAYMDTPKGDKHGVIRTGRHFNVQLLLEAFELYYERYDQLGGPDSWKNNCFWRQVIGYIQRHVPACYAQAFCQGLWGIVDNDAALRRVLKFSHGANISFFPLNSSPHARLGHDYAAGSGGWPLSDAKCIFVSLIRDFCNKKQACIDYVDRQARSHINSRHA